MGRVKKQIKRAKGVYGLTEKPRLVVNKSIKHISAQVIDDEKGVTLAGIKSDKGSKNNIETAKVVGQKIAEKAKAAGVTKVAFDRRNYLYHGKIKALADAARKNGLEF